MSRAELIAFTAQGVQTALSIADALGGCARVSAPERFADGGRIGAFESLETWTGDAFASADALVFVGATGIAVRAVAPHVDDKLVDPAVVCVDELGRVAVPLLSGHVGGANDLARAIAEAMGGIAAISTATDLNGTFAIDEFARENGLVLENRELAKEISAALLDGARVTFEGGLGAQIGQPDGSDGTLFLVPRDVVVGVGCRRGSSREALACAIDAALDDAGLAAESVRALATIDVKADEDALVQLARDRKWELLFFSADALARQEGDFDGSDFVREAVGVDNVCERAVVAAGAHIVLGKQVGNGVAVAIGRIIQPDRPRGRKGCPPTAARRKSALSHPGDGCPSAQAADTPSAPSGYVGLVDTVDTGIVRVVGLGPGGGDGMTFEARRALEASDAIFGYTAYIDLIAGQFPHKDLRATGMRQEVERCRMALAEAAAGKAVALVCSGDAGVYGMASPVLELAGKFPDVEVEVVPGVTAATAGAAALGAPLSHDFAVVSLSDLLTPWDVIERRLNAAARAGFCICLYNPSSRKRSDYLQRACDVLLRSKPAQTVCGIARNIARDGQETRILTLGELRDTPVDMFATVFVGNSDTRVLDGKMVTPRGYTMEGAVPDGTKPAPAPSPQPGTPTENGESATTATAPSPQPGITAEDGRSTIASGSATASVSPLRPCTHAGDGGSAVGAHSVRPAREARCEPPATSAAHQPAILLYGGTSEARELAEWLNARASCRVVYCAATEYGAQLVAGLENVVPLAGPLDADAKERLLAEHGFTCIVDATHPYATHVSATLREFADAHGIALLRLVREDDAAEDLVTVRSAKEAAAHVATLPGNILVTTGAKELAAFVRAIPDFAERLFARILPVVESIDIARGLGLPARNIIGMQGPFSVAMNEALMRELDIRALVTKASGSAGGFAEKVEAARRCGAETIVIGRPVREEGLGIADVKQELEERHGA